jgi:hypothetical protein
LLTDIIAQETPLSQNTWFYTKSFISIWLIHSEFHKNVRCDIFKMNKKARVQCMNEKAVWKQHLKWGQDSHFYKTLNQRRFRKVSGYGRFDRAIASIATILRSGEAAKESYFKNDIGFSIALRVFSDLVACANDFPVLAIDRGLLNALDKTMVPPDIAFMKCVFPVGLILLPQKLIKTSDGDWIDWLVFRHYLKGEILNPIKLEDGLSSEVIVDRNSIAWATQPSGITWASNQPLDSDWGVQDDEMMIATAPGNITWDATEDDRDLSERLSLLVGNILLYLQSQPDDNLSSESNVFNGMGFGNNTSGRRSPKILTPRWVGRSYTQSETKSESRPRYKHESPQPHWRRGHWRRVPVGKGRQAREWRWIKPVLVNIDRE